MPRSKEDDAARKQEVAATVDDPVAVEAATLGAAMAVAATVKYHEMILCYQDGFCVLFFCFCEHYTTLLKMDASDK